MNVRSVQREIKTLKSKIDSDLKSISLISSFNEDNRLIGTRAPDEYEKYHTAQWQSINDNIKRSEALKSALVLSNATVKVSIPKFRNFDSLAISLDVDDMVDVTIADDIRKK